jgi:hypothetical protein
MGDLVDKPYFIYRKWSLNLNIFLSDY